MLGFGCINLCTLTNMFSGTSARDSVTDFLVDTLDIVKEVLVNATEKDDTAAMISPKLYLAGISSSLCFRLTK